MRKFAYKIPLCGEYELSNLLPGETVDDFGFQHEPLLVRIIKCSGVTSRKNLFEPVSPENDNSSLTEGIIKAIKSGYHNNWQPCGAYITSEGLRIRIVNCKTKEQKLFRLAKIFSSITMHLVTRDEGHDLWHIYQYQEYYRRRTGEHFVEVTEYKDGIKGYCAIQNNYCIAQSDFSVIRFINAGDGNTDMMITDYCS